MHVVDISTELRAPASAVWGSVNRPGAFRLVTRGLLRMPALASRKDMWREGETVSGWVFLFGVIPFSRHVLHVAEIDDERLTLRSEEHGGLVRRWHHDIVVTPTGHSACRYRDRIEIEAGPLTAVVTAWAHVFYLMRQRRWRQLALALGDPASSGSDRRPLR